MDFSRSAKGLTNFMLRNSVLQDPVSQWSALSKNHAQATGFGGFVGQFAVPGLSDIFGRRGMAVNSMVAGGCIISGAHVRQSLLSNDVRIEDSSIIENSVLLPSVTIGRRCRITRCILDENCVIPDGTQIGQDRALDQQRFFVTKRGVVLVTQDMLRAQPVQ